MGGKNSKNCKAKQLIQESKANQSEKGDGANSKCPVKRFNKRSVQWASSCWSTTCKFGCFKAAETDSSPVDTTDDSASSPSKSSSSGTECPFKPRKPCAETPEKAALLNEAIKCPFKDATSPASICKSKADAKPHHRVEFIESPLSLATKCPVSASSSQSSLTEFYEFNEKEKRLLSFSFELIKHDLNTVGVIAFMK